MMVPKYLYHSEMGAALPSNPLLDGTPTLRLQLDPPRSVSRPLFPGMLSGTPAQTVTGPDPRMVPRLDKRMVRRGNFYAGSATMAARLPGQALD
jgi:hypothetical protein